jgi:catechol 2,3-dioxygenase-like lactoylglutathione lyase family enzyme
MAKIKHIALSTQDPEKTAQFYVDVFGMKQIGRVNHPVVSGYFLSDGDINLAVLNFKDDAAAGAERGKDYCGLHHIGFQVDSLEAIAERLAAAGSERRDDVNEALGVGQSGTRHANVEVKYSGPDGIMLDVSETGWVGAAGFRPL